MKIRTGFVTNSSSSSYIAISITSEKLAEILKEYEELEEYFDTYEVSEKECCIGGVDLCECTPYKLDDVMDTLIEFLSETTDCWLEEEEEIELQDDDEPLMKLIKELTGQKAELRASIKKVDWSCEASAWGGDGDSRMLESSYSKETLEKIYGKIAKEKGCSIDEVTEDDFRQYAAERTGTQREHFKYSKARGGKYTSSYDLSQ